MRGLIKELIPHAPQLGLFVAPNIPSDRLARALDDFASTFDAADVAALYDATLLGSGKDGAVFAVDRMAFQNNSLEPVHVVRYGDIVGVDEKRKLMGGRRVVLSVNRGRATFDLTIDFSGRPKAAVYVARFLKEAMLRGDASQPQLPHATTDVDRVSRSLHDLHNQGLLSTRDLNRLLNVLGEISDTES